MKIAIDALPLLGKAGISVHQRCLIKALLDLDTESQYHFFFRYGLSQRHPPADWGFDNHRVHRHAIAVPDRILEFLWTHHAVHLAGTERFFQHCDVFYATTYFCPVLRRMAIVSSVYDLTPLKFEVYRRDKDIFERRLSNTIQRSAYILTNSEFTKKDLCQSFSVDENRVVAAPLAVTPDYKPLDDVERLSQVRQRYRLGSGPYLLYVGNLGPHKNVVTLIRVFDRIKKEERIPHRLVLCGSTAWGQDVLETIRRLHREDDIIVTGFVPETDLPWIYNGADVFLYLSLYEGFGLPVLEAMACGVPVITSSVSSLPEVAGDAAVLVDPQNEQEIQRAVLELLASEDLRQSLRAKGLERARQFSWDDTARKTLEVFRKAGQQLP